MNYYYDLVFFINKLSKNELLLGVIPILILPEHISKNKIK